MARDPYKYFRIEARELVEGLTEGVLQHDKGSAGPEVVARLLRLAHTLKGAARVVKQPGIAELAHTVEDALTRESDEGRPPSRGQGSELLGLLDQITSHLATLEPAPELAPASPAAATEEPLETLRVEVDEMDSLLAGVTEACVQLGAVRQGIGATDRLADLTNLILGQLAVPAGDGDNGSEVDGEAGRRAMARARTLAEEMRSSLKRFGRSLSVDLGRVEGDLAEIRDIVHRLRLIPAQSVFSSLDRVVRDAAQALGKRVDFEASGGGVHLDANVLASLRDPLMHVARNAVVHGAQTEGERVAAGKSPTGRVRLAVERRGSRVAFVCSDDGRGIDVEAVKKAAVARGLVPASEAKSLPSEKVFALLSAGGLTTSGAVTELSGRGIGLDVVRATTARLKGELSIRSEPGRGATVEVQVPVSIASLAALVVEAGGLLAAIPLYAVRETLQLRPTDIARSAERDSIVHEGQAIPFVPLDVVLRGVTARNAGASLAVVVQAGQRRVALAVDKLLGTSSIVVRSLPGAVDADPVVSGASLDAEGNPELVLDPEGLVAAAELGHGTTPDERPPRRAPVLVIDDSLTTRMLEQSILESAGYEVELAVSAEEALSKSRDRRYSMFIVDVEMPGMDGFEFVARTRSDSALRDIPAILVTSRNAAEDRQRGEQVGARAYIVKGEFDQGQLLQTIRSLIA
jgi:two-component system chemotaxis sensor kinase CheA